MLVGRGVFYVSVVNGSYRRSAMNKAEAKSILTKELAKFASLPFGQLAASINRTEVKNVRGESGVNYQIEVNV